MLTSKLRLLSIIRIQSYRRMTLFRRKFQVFRSSAINIQAVVRGWMSRRLQLTRHYAATTIQQSWRGFSDFVRFFVLKGDVTLAQSIVRRRLARRAFDRKKTAMAIIQKTCRGRLVRSRCRLLNHLAALVQSVYRRHSARKEYLKNIVKIVAVQCFVRAWIARKAVKQRSESLCLIQSTARKFLATRLFQQKLAMRDKQYVEERSCTRIQALFRGHVARVALNRHAAATTLQKTWRCFNAHVDYVDSH